MAELLAKIIFNRPVASQVCYDYTNKTSQFLLGGGGCNYLLSSRATRANRYCRAKNTLKCTIFLFKLKKNPCFQEILGQWAAERAALAAQLTLEGAGFLCPVLAKTLRFGIGYHHRSGQKAGLKHSRRLCF